jgi:hypothetical protein
VRLSYKSKLIIFCKFCFKRISDEPETFTPSTVNSSQAILPSIAFPFELMPLTASWFPPDLITVVLFVVSLFQNHIVPLIEVPTVLLELSSAAHQVWDFVRVAKE